MGAAANRLGSLLALFIVATLMMRIEFDPHKDASNRIKHEPMTGVLHYIAFVDRGDFRRVISLRRANKREVEIYAEAREEDSDPDAHGS